jgi:hypothetical protein
MFTFIDITAATLVEIAIRKQSLASNLAIQIHLCVLLKTGKTETETGALAFV